MPVVNENRCRTIYVSILGRFVCFRFCLFQIKPNVHFQVNATIFIYLLIGIFTASVDCRVHNHLVLAIAISFGANGSSDDI